MAETAELQDDEGRAETLASSAYERLRVDLIRGEFEPGDKLLIRELCARYEIGLSPIREALNRLSHDGLVQQSDQRGFSVTPLTEESLVDLTRIRCWSNEAALRQSIANGDQAWEERLVVTLYRMTRQFGPNDYSRDMDLQWEESHRAFHSALIAACGSKILTDFCEHLFDMADRYRFLAHRVQRGKIPPQDDHPAMDPWRDEHREIMDAALRRDADEAVRLQNEHFMRTLEFSRAEIRRLTTGKTKTTRRRHPKAA